MKVTGNRPTPAKEKSEKSRKATNKAKGKLFSGLLRKPDDEPKPKEGRLDTRIGQQALQREREESAGQANPLLHHPDRGPTAAAASTRPSSAPDWSKIQSIVNEVRVGVNKLGESQVQVQLNSKTLKGLKIELSREGGQISVRFLSQTDEVSRLLSQNASQLIESLSLQGIPIGRVSIHTGEQITSTYHSTSDTSRQEDRSSSDSGEENAGQERGEEADFQEDED